ncbi:hypothetical protein KSP39_PZI002036 [Platanthera zijinensis]|uniref:Uncharacterized protein n=1 Tax=Platanthera zijinensis TaxID=2320716 RepID=A0AAP0BYW6_9ASPA
MTGFATMVGSSPGFSTLWILNLTGWQCIMIRLNPCGRSFTPFTLVMTAYNICMILFPIFRILPGAPGDMLSFVAKAKSLAEAWIQHQPPTTDLTTQRNQKEAVSIAMMMSRVPPHLHSIRAQILSSATTPSLPDVCSMLLKVTPPSEAPHDFAPVLLQLPLLPNPPTRGSSTRGGRPPSRGRGRGGRSSMKCTYCGRDNHLEATCYRKHGLPPHLTATTTAAPPPTGPSAPDLASTTRQDIDELRTQLQQLQGALSRSSGSVASFSAEGSSHPEYHW